MDIHIQNKRAWKPKISQLSIEIRSQRLLSSTRSARLHYFKNYASVASFMTLRLLFALTSIPNFQVLQYDVSVAFIQSKLD